MTESTSTMRAIVQRSYAATDAWHLGDLPVPVPGDGEVLIAVHAAGLDRGTWHLMVGLPRAARLAFGLRRPRNPVPGLDLAGRVVAVGTGVTRFGVGDEVLGIGAGSFAQFAIAKESKLAHKPAGVPFESAAVVAVSGLTAIQALDLGGVDSGSRVLITGASGGVGSYAVQIAAARGACVTAVCSTSKVELVRSLGATDVIDYSAQDVTTTDGRFDVVLDIAGGQPLSRLRRLVDGRGTLVVVGAEDNGNLIGMRRQLLAVLTSPFVRQRLRMMVSNENSADLERLVELIERGDLTPSVGHTVPLDQAAGAMALLVRGEARGKIAIAVQPASVSTPPAEVSSRVV